uniref:Uncharacterized protein n=1 Tax=Haptolina brevifila TaxID=156173 RepID=A0A7S2J5G0_9EUKA
MGSLRLGARILRGGAVEVPREGLYNVVLEAYDEECSESWGRALFGNNDANHLYQDTMLRKARDRQLWRAGRRTAWDVDWRHLRNVCEHALRNAITRLVPVVRRKKKELATAVDLGVGAAFSADTFARHLQAKQAAISDGARAAGFSRTDGPQRQSECDC